MSEPAGLRTEDIIELNPVFLYRWEEPQQSHVLLYPEGLVKLNETAAAVLGQCLIARPVADVIRTLAEAYETDDITADVIQFLDTAMEKGWVRRV